jgi:hypothetical protein
MAPISGILLSVKTTNTASDSTKPGDNIDSWCGKCKMMLAHTIEAMVGKKPARVSCNTCRTQHAYKANPPGESTKKVPGAAPSVRRTANKYQSLLKANGEAVAKAYSQASKYELGDVLEHPTFGRGVATAIRDATKIEVLFETGSKTLIHGR